MGHQRLGKLPASKKWRDIVAYLTSGNDSVSELANLVLDACDHNLNTAHNDPAFKEAINLLCRIPLAAKSDNLREAFALIGIDIPDNPTRTDIIAGFEQSVEKAQRSHSKNVTDLSEIAKQAGIAALNSLLVKPSPPPQMTLWDAPIEGVHLALRQSADPEGFADLAQSFFANFGANNIRYFMDRELPKHLGESGFVKSIPDMILFDQNNQRHNQEASTIMRFFAKEWYAKTNYHSKKQLTPKDISGFARVATEKMRKEYRMRSANNEAV